ncbi:YggT family protein [Pseudomonas syringae]|nr:YggT family protein [Pseudomonas syringae]MBD8577697.1 YggT family protein [Pseudomonas syringae]MBD8792258.1 YggT family protein [Pseudomonas syringae]MBD8803607.1 YggT family protein [Pseudomonas syringae]MBD8814389.1 YggT family protein [Pseudomonas syringae]
MTELTNAASFIVTTLGSLYLLIVMLRFVLQLVRADFYNPMSQFIVKATQPLLRPMRRAIPSLFGLDMSSLVLGIIVQMLVMAAVLMLEVGTIDPYRIGILGAVLHLLVWALIGVTVLLLNIFFWALLISVILSWVAPASHNPAAQLVNQICEPLLAPLRQRLPNLGGLDLSPIVAFMAIKLIEMTVIVWLIKMSAMPTVLRLLI